MRAAPTQRQEKGTSSIITFLLTIVTHGPCWGLRTERDMLRRFSHWPLRPHPLSLSPNYSDSSIMIRSTGHVAQQRSGVSWCMSVAHGRLQSQPRNAVLHADLDGVPSIVHAAIVGCSPAEWPYLPQVVAYTAGVPAAVMTVLAVLGLEALPVPAERCVGPNTANSGHQLLFQN